MNTTPLIIEETNLSKAWLNTFEFVTKNPGKEISPLIITLTDFQESDEIRAALDLSLKKNKKGSIQTVAETIFPHSLYLYLDQDRKALYREYKKNIPRLRSIDKRNQRGTYFERLIAYDGEVNQLEIIISSYLKDKGVRRSKLQASIFDAKKDHINNRYQGFPCLQHVTFCVTKKGGLILNSFYAIQYLYERGYGNWLGLIYLGKFMANEMGLKFERFNCFIGIEQLDHIKKSRAEKLLKTLKK